MTFDAMFSSQRWHDRKQELLAAAEWLCVECGSDVEEDGVHICFYPKGRLVWDYPERAFKVLCPVHRRERGAFERQLREMLPEFTTADLGVFLDAIEQLKMLDISSRSRAMEELRGSVKRGSGSEMTARDLEWLTTADPPNHG